MGLKDISIPSGENRVTSGLNDLRSDYIKKQSEESQLIPSWKSLDLTQFVAQPIVDVQDQIGDLVDGIVEILEWTKELAELVGKLIQIIPNALEQTALLLKQLVDELLSLLNLDDAGIYALYIPYHIGGSNYYMKTFLDSLADVRDLQRPQMPYNNFAGAMFIKAGHPTYDLDFDQAMKNLKSRFFGLKENFEVNNLDPVPNDFTAKCLMTPILKSETKTSFNSNEAKKEQSKVVLTSPEEEALNYYNREIFESTSKYLTSVKKTSTSPQLNANLRWTTPPKWGIDHAAKKKSSVIGKVVNTGLGKGTRTDLYTLEKCTITSVYVIRAEDSTAELNDVGKITSTIAQLADSPSGTSLVVGGTNVKVTRLEPHFYREFYYDDSLEVPNIDTVTGIARNKVYYYNMRYGYKKTIATRKDVYTGEIKNPEAGKDLELTNEVLDSTYELDPTGKMSTTSNDSLKNVRNFFNSNVYANSNFYGREVEEFGGKEKIGNPTQTLAIENESLQGDISGNPPDWISFRVFADMFPGIKEFIEELRNLVNNILDGIINMARAMQDAVEKVVRDIQDLIDAAIAIVQLLDKLLFPPIVGIYATAFTTTEGIDGIVKKFKASLNVADKPTSNSFGSQYIKEEDDGAYNAVSKSARFDIVPYFPEDHKVGGFVFAFGSIATYEAFKMFFDADRWETIYSDWKDLFDAKKQLGLNHIKIPELTHSTSRRDRRRSERNASAGIQSQTINPYQGSDDAYTKYESDVITGQVEFQDNDIDNNGNGRVVSENGAPYVAPDGINTFGLSASGVNINALMPKGSANADLVVAAINSAYNAVGGSGNLANAYGGYVEFTTPPASYGDGSQSITFGYSEYNSVLGVVSGSTIFGRDLAEEFATDGNVPFAYKPKDLLVEIVGENGVIGVDRKVVPATYIGDYFDNSDEQDLNEYYHHLSLNIDGIPAWIDVTGNAGTNPKLKNASFFFYPMGIAPYVIDNSNYQFNFEAIGLGAGYPTGPVLIELLQMSYPDIETLGNRILISLHTAGFTLGTFNIEVSGSSLIFSLKRDATRGSSYGFIFTSGTADALVPLGISNGTTIFGTDLVKYTIEEVRDNINASLFAINSQYGSVCTIADGNLKIRGLVKGDQGNITIESIYNQVGYPPVIYGNEESSVVSKIIFGTNPKRSFPVSVNGIGKPGFCINYDLEIVGRETRDLIVSKDHVDVLETVSGIGQDTYLSEMVGPSAIEYIVEIV